MEEPMPITEEKALEILTELIKKPESKSEDIPRIWNEIIGIYNQQFSPTGEVAPKKRRRRASNPNVGWPAGVKRDEYMAWKEQQIAKGIETGINPQEYKRRREAGEVKPFISNPKEAARSRIEKATASRRELRGS
jgi:hypothetical protein